MNRLQTHVRLLVCACAALLTPLAFAAAPAGPTTYTIINPPPTGKDMSTNIYRDGAREMFRMSRANGWHSEQWFDYAAHKSWVADSNAPGKCSVITYTDDRPSPFLDPVPGAFAMAAQIPANVPSSGKEKLGQFNTRVLDLGGGAKLWVDDADHLVIKALTPFETDGDKQPTLTVTIDLTHLSFAKPDPALLTPPANCTRIKGSSNAFGGHAEVPVSADIPAHS